MKKSILITGSRGQLGTDLVDFFSPDYNVIGINIEDVDITKADPVNSMIKKIKPDIVIHTAAYIDVDGCESNPELAMAVNCIGTANVARACKEIGARMIYYSTDYVFDGNKRTAYLESDTPDPQTVYGMSKWAGEKKITEILNDFTVIRIAWVYGFSGKNFVKTMLRLGWDQIEHERQGKSKSPLNIVSDQIGNPTWTMEIGRQTQVILENNLNGIIHGTSEGETSWYNFARAIFENFEMKVNLVPCTTAEFPRPAPRPKNSALDNSRLKKAGLNVMSDWKKALKEFTLKYRSELKI